MARSLPFSIWVAELELATGSSIYTPLLIPQVVGNYSSLDDLSQALQEAFQREFIEKGSYVRLLSQLIPLRPRRDQVKITLDTSVKDLLSDKIEVSFDIAVSPLPHGGYIAFAPALGIETMALKEDKIVKRLVDNIKLEFARRKRLSHTRPIITTQWFQKMTLREVEIDLDFYTLPELRELAVEQMSVVLPKTADRMVKGPSQLFGRTSEMDQIHRTMTGRYSRNLLLVGPTGVGKTALIREMVRRKKDMNLGRTEVWETTASRMIQRLSEGEGWQQNLGHLLVELSERGDYLYVRNLMELFEVGQYIGNPMSMADFLREPLQRGELTLISECTDEELAQIEVRSSGFSSLFHIIRVEEPKGDELEEILLKRVAQMAEGIQVEIGEEAVRETLRLQKRYSPYSGFPGKPLRFLENLLYHRKQGGDTLTGTEVIQGFCEETGMPRFMIDPAIPLGTEDLVQHFERQIYGQKSAVKTVTDLLVSVKTSLTRRGRPIASLLFVGPTGVGKTEMAKVLAEYMFSSRDRLLRLDMSEYSDPFSVLRLTGLSYRQEGLLTAAVRQQPFSVVLFDELEKAHPAFYDLLLQILGEGRLTDSQGKVADFCSTIIIMTSNIGARSFQKNQVGFGEEGDLGTMARNHFTEEVQNFFRPELFNRLDQVIPFLPLSREVLPHIAKREMDQLTRREGIRYRDLDLRLDPDLHAYLGEKGYDHHYGARHLQRTLREEIILPISQQINRYGAETPLQGQIKVVDDKLHLDIKARGEKPRRLNQIPGSKLTWEEVAHNLSQSRREVQNLEDGSSFLELASRLDMLESKKRELGEKFWRTSESKRYKLYCDLVLEMEQLFESIEKLEVRGTLAYLHREEEDSSVLTDYEKWREVLDRLKLDLYTTLYPQDDRCVLSMYGSADRLSKLSMEFQGIAKKRDYQTIRRTVWFRQKHYDSSRDDRKKYLYLDYQIPPFAPAEKGDILVGVEAEVMGPAAYLFFRDLEGKVTWDIEQYSSDVIFIQCGRGTFQRWSTPLEIHRRQFYENLPHIWEIHMDSIHYIPEDRHLNCSYHNQTRAWTTVLNYLFQISLHQALGYEWEDPEE